MSDAKIRVVVCPQCRRPEVHFARPGGFYCKACGRKFNSEEAKAFVEHEVFKMEAGNRASAVL